jgi:hypothetical protein
MASIWGFICCPNGVDKKSAGRPVAQEFGGKDANQPRLASPNKRPLPLVWRLTADPRGNLGPRQEPDHVLGERITVELQQVIVARGVPLFQVREVIVKDVERDLGTAAGDHV